MQKNTKKVSIIGAGYAGLALGALLAKHGLKVTVFEAHSYLGGCASFFKRGAYLYDCGATTLSGLAPNRPLSLLLKELDLSLKTTFNEVNSNQPLETPIVIKLSTGKTVYRFRDFEKFIRELENKFPGLPHRTLWKKLKSFENRLWELLGLAQHFPPENLTDTKAFLNLKTLKGWDLGIMAFLPLKKIIPAKMLENLEYCEFLNEQLLISTQSTLEKVPVLLGAMGLVYPEDMHYSIGGISQLAYQLKESIEKKRRRGINPA